MIVISLFGILDFFIGICLLFGFYFLVLILSCLSLRSSLAAYKAVHLTSESLVMGIDCLPM